MYVFPVSLKNVYIAFSLMVLTTLVHYHLLSHVYEILPLFVMLLITVFYTIF